MEVLADPVETLLCLPHLFPVLFSLPVLLARGNKTVKLRDRRTLLAGLTGEKVTLVNL